MNRKILISGLSILSALSLLGAATFAYFSDVGNSTGNTFSTGTLNLELADVDESYTVGDVSASFGGTLSPGSCTGDQTLTLRNNGTVPGDHVEISLANTVTDTDSNANPDMDSYLRLQKLQYDGASVLDQLTTLNSNGFYDLQDLQVNGLDNLSLNAIGTGKNLVLDVCLDAAAPNEIQNDSVASVFTVTLNQNSSQ